MVIPLRTERVYREARRDVHLGGRGVGKVDCTRQKECSGFPHDGRKYPRYFRMINWEVRRKVNLVLALFFHEVALVLMYAC